MPANYAKLQLLFASPGEIMAPLAIEIGIPTPCPEHQQEWLCQLSLSPLLPKPLLVRAGDPLQPLCLAVDLLRELLDNFIRVGGRLAFVSGEDWPLFAYHSPKGSGDLFTVRSGRLRVNGKRLGISRE